MRPCTLLAIATCTAAIALPIADAHAASLEVLAAAANSGSKGLRVTVGSSCTSATNVDLDGQTISGPSTIEGCESVSSNDTTISSGDVVFRTGRRVVLGDGFSVSSGARFIVEVDTDLGPSAFVEDDTPSSEKHYAAAFFINADLLALPASERFDLLTGMDGMGVEWFAVVLKRADSVAENRLLLEVRLDDGSIASTEGFNEVVLPAGWSWVAVDWKARTGSFGGYINLRLDGTLMAGTGGVNTHGEVDTVRFGAQGVMPLVSGSFDADRFISRIAGPIAPP